MIIKAVLYCMVFIIFNKILLRKLVNESKFYLEGLNNKERELAERLIYDNNLSDIQYSFLANQIGVNINKVEFVKDKVLSHQMICSMFVVSSGMVTFLFIFFF